MRKRTKENERWQAEENEAEEGEEKGTQKTWENGGRGRKRGEGERTISSVKLELHHGVIRASLVSPRHAGHAASILSRRVTGIMISAH